METICNADHLDSIMRQLRWKGVRRKSSERMLTGVSLHCGRDIADFRSISFCTYLGGCNVVTDDQYSTYCIYFIIKGVHAEGIKQKKSLRGGEQHEENVQYSKIAELAISN